MRSGLLEFLGGAFIFTAITYATGKGYFNSYFREINVDPSLIDLTVDQIFFEGGRQIVLILNNFLVPAFFLLVFYVICCFFASVSIKKKIEEKYAEEIFEKFSVIKGLFVIGFFIWFSNYSFNSAMKSGRDVGSKNKCIIVVVHSTENKDEQSGCLVYKTIDNIWIKYISDGNITVSIFPRDNFYRVDTVAQKVKELNH